MRLSRLQQYLLAPAFIAALFILTSPILSAQQVSYYDFDVPANTSVQDSYVCTSGTVVSMAAAGTLFCFNYSTGTGQSPDSLFLDLYPADIDPNPADNPPIASTHYAAQLTPAIPTESSSMWFSVPQKITYGFNAYFAFKITTTTSQADGLAFVIQNALGGGADPTTGCVEQGSGPSAVSTNALGGCIGYGGIDNSVALEMDTFDNVPWGDPNNN